MKNTPNNPIFLIGAARSGTKFARSILAASKDTASVDYDINYIWRYGNEGLDHDELDAASLTPKIKRFIRKEINRQAGIDNNETITLIEKTVGNTLRVSFIDAVFPEARFIHLVRDGRAVTESSMRMWKASPDTGSLLKKLRKIPFSSAGYVLWFGYNFAKGLVTGRGGGQVWGPRYKGIMEDVANERPLVEICAHQWKRSVEMAHEDLAKIDESRIFTLNYNDLVSSEEKIQKMLTFANIKDVESVMKHYRATVRGGNDEKWRKSLSEDDQKKMMTVLALSLKKFNILAEKDPN